MEEVVELVTLGKDEKEEEEGKEEVWKGEEEKEQHTCDGWGLPLTPTSAFFFPKEFSATQE